ncbi:MAG: ATP-grasp domain-containing protein [Deltaproteobacteria bacterium]|nr:ATP-grasp domain-containing protein [Deltaproteobacteria bacterium]
MHEPARERILILDGDSRSALAATRSLGRAGYPVSVLASRRDALAFASRYVSEVLLAPSPLDSPEAYAEIVTERVSRDDLAAMLHCSRASITALTGCRAELEKHTTLPLASASILEQITDKMRLSALLDELEIPAPAHTVIETPESRLPVIRFAFPGVVKPHRPFAKINREYHRLRARVVRNLDDLSLLLRTFPPEAFPYLVQQYMAGEVESYFGLYRDGEPIVEFGQRRLREYPPMGGASVLRQAEPPDPKVVEWSRRLLRRLKYDGPVHVEYRRDRPGGTPRLIKVNAHFWASLQMAIDAGVDLPVLSVRAARGQVTPTPVIRTGVRSRWLLGDYLYLIEYLRHGSAAVRSTYRAPSRLEFLAQFIADMNDPATHLEIKSADDPLPYKIARRRMLRDWLRGLGRRPLARVGLQIDRYKGLVITTDSPYVLSPNTLAGLRNRLDARGMRFAFLSWDAAGFNDKDVAQFVDMCERESTEEFLLIPGLIFRIDAGLSILGMGVRRAYDVGDPIALVRRIREDDGLAVLARANSGELDRHPDLVDELSGVVVWDLERDGRIAPKAGTLFEFTRALERSPYLVAFQTVPLHLAEKLRFGFIRVVSARFNAAMMTSSLGSGLFYLRGILFSSRSDRISFGVYLMYTTILEGLADLLKRGKSPNERNMETQA